MERTSRSTTQATGNPANKSFEQLSCHFLVLTMASILSSDKKTTALPYGDDSYECFVTKGSCRKCGCVAYGKQRCSTCDRKYCADCAPHSLQPTSGREEWQKVYCVACKPTAEFSSFWHDHIKPWNRETNVIVSPEEFDRRTFCPQSTKLTRMASIDVETAIEGNEVDKIEKDRQVEDTSGSYVTADEAQMSHTMLCSVQDFVRTNVPHTLGLVDS